MAGAQGNAIAVVGMAGRFPGARDLAAFWDNLRAGTMSLTRLPDDQLRRAGVLPDSLADPDYVKVAFLLEDFHRFEPALFGITPREAEAMDPQMRVLLEVSHDALQDAGYDPRQFSGRIGMYAGAGHNEYLTRCVRASPRFMELIGEARARIANHADFLATCISYHLGLRGPSISAVTACSTSLVNVHLARAALLTGECDMAVAGGADIPLSAGRGYRYSEGGGILAADGVIRPYDAGASGTVFGGGAGAVVLRRLSDAVADRDAIHAVIIASAVNNDGAARPAYAAPSAAGQADVLTAALRTARIDPASVGYVEGHGTGMPAGDSTELAALNQVYGAGGRDSRDIALGSVKGNVGHLGAAAGISGFIKAACSVREGMIPASLNCRNPSPHLDAGPFYVAGHSTRWPPGPGPRRAAVSAFGVGGTNAHLILEQPPQAETGAARQPYQLLAFSARTPTALAAMEEAVRSRLIGGRPADPARDLADLAYTLTVGRPGRAVRRCITAASPADAAAQLGARRAGPADSVRRGLDPAAVFVMPGPGAQYAGMARGLYEREPEFAAVVNHCCAVLRQSHDLDLSSFLFPRTAPALAGAGAGASISRISVTQPALFTVEYALARLLISAGIRPAAMAGHGIGEYVAAVLAGVMEADDALRLAADSGALIEPLPPGFMTAVWLPEADLLPLLPPGVDLAAVDGPGRCVVAGPRAAVRQLELSLAARNVATSRLAMAHACHSRMMDPVLEPLVSRVASVRLRAPDIPIMSGVTGDWITAGQATDPAYWAQAIRARVRFVDVARNLLADRGYCFAEVGPGEALSSLVLQTATSVAGHRPGLVTAVPMLRAAGDERDDQRVLLEGLGRLWSGGCRVDWHRFWAPEKRGRVRVPAYPYERESFWVSPEAGDAGDSPDKPPLYVPAWTETSLPPAPAADDARAWVVFAHPGEAVTGQLIRLMRAAGGTVTIVVPAGRYAPTAGGGHAIRPREAADYGRVAAAVLSGGPGRIGLVHAWLLGGSATRTEQAALRMHLDLGLDSLLLTIQEFSRPAARAALEISVLTSEMQDVLGDGAVRPAKAAVRELLTTTPPDPGSVTVRGVDVGAGRAAVISAQLFRELRSGAADREVALRGRKRWVAGCSAVRLDEAAGMPSVLTEGGVYVISGGLGRLGLELARELARRARARVVLVGEPGLPPRPAWASLAAGSPDEALRERLRAILAVEEAAGPVLVYTGDATDETRMRQVRAEVMRARGQVDGVFHLAGVGDAGRAGSTALGAAGQVAPRVAGAYVLDRVFRPPLLVLCSAGADSADRGQRGRAAISACLDAYAQAQWGAGRHVVSVSWPRWTDAGLAGRAGNALPDEHCGDAVSPAGAARVLGSILASGAGPQILVSPGERPSRGWPAGQVTAGAGPAAGVLAARYAVPAYAPPQTDAEQKLAALCQQAVGVERVGLDDDFQELGLSSLTAVRLARRVSEVFGVDVSVAEFFGWQTLRAAAGAVQTALSQQ